MRARLCLLFLLILVPALGHAQAIIRDQATQTVAATQTNTSVTPAWPAWVLIRNDGTQDVHVQLAGTTATTSDFTLPAGAFLSPPAMVSRMGFICATGESTTVEVLMLRGTP